MNKIKTGVIGCGRFGTYHIKVLRKLLNKSQLIASDINQQNLDTISTLVNKTYLDYTVMIKENRDLQAVFVVCPTILHYRIARYCLNAGLHVFVEKPLTTNSKQAKSLIKLAKQKRKILVPGHLFLYKKAYQLIKKYFNNRYRHNFILVKRLNNGPTILDEGVIFDLAVHDIYMTLNLLKDTPQSVSATGIDKNSALVGTTITLRFKRALVQISVGWTALSSTREMHILNGENEFYWNDVEPGTLNIKQTSTKKPRKYLNQKITLYGSDTTSKTFTQFNENALLKEDGCFLQSLKNGRPFINPCEGYLTVKVMEEIRQSLKL